jgi:hypothetical protein
VACGIATVLVSREQGPVAILLGESLMDWQDPQRQLTITGNLSKVGTFKIASLDQKTSTFTTRLLSHDIVNIYNGVVFR